MPANTTFVSDTQTGGPAFSLTSPAQGGTGTITGTIATLASGTSATFSVVVLVSPSTPSGTTISNTANVTAATSDPDVANNSATATNLTTSQADLSATTIASAGVVFAGNTIAYTITLANAGPSDAQNVGATNFPPTNTTFVSEAQTSGPPFGRRLARQHGRRVYRHVARGRLGEFHLRGSGIAQHAGRNDDQRHNDNKLRYN